jgi:hypothetical protein
MSELDERTQSEKLAAEALVAALEADLRRLGYQFAVVSIAKRIDVGDQAAAPGATLCFSQCTMVQALPHHARVLRLIADNLDRMWAQSEAPAAATSNVEDVTYRHRHSSKTDN